MNHWGKNDRNHEYQDSNYSASIPDSFKALLMGNFTHQNKDRWTMDRCQGIYCRCWRGRRLYWGYAARFKVQVYFALFKLIQYKMAYRISRLTNDENKYINIQICWYVHSDQSTEAFVLVTAREGRPLGEASPHLTCKLAYINKNH